MKKLIIYKDNVNNKIDSKTFLYNGNINNLYKGQIINPPFFEEIKIINNRLNENDIYMLLNMIYINGNIYMSSNYKIIIEKYKDNFTIKKDKDNIILTKKNNHIISIKPKIIDFIIMGTQKGGTTALATNISNHPDIYINGNRDPLESEIHFFDLYWDKGIEWYKKKFDYSKKIIGEKTPNLMYLYNTFPLIQSINPFVKIIIILRDPIERAYSAWKMHRKRFQTKDFMDAINDELDNKIGENRTFYTSKTHYLQRGLYYEQIQELLKWFNKDNILILISEEIKDNMTEYYNKVYNFLNLKNIDMKYTLEHISDKEDKINNNDYNKLIYYFKDDFKKLEKLLNRKIDWLKKR